MSNFTLTSPILTVRGSLGPDGVQINYNHILTKLIQEVGTHCKSYASDLFLDWHQLILRMSSSNFTSETLMFGIRETGVDHESFISARLSKKNNIEDEIENIYVGGIWMLEVEVINGMNDKAMRPVEMRFGRASLRK